MPAQAKQSEEPAGIDRRNEIRLRVDIPIEVTWTGAEGRQITERTFVEDVSDFGCRFSTRKSMKQGDTVSVQLLSRNGKFVSSDKPKAFTIMWISRKLTGMTVGARLQGTDQIASTKAASEAAPSAEPTK